MPFPTPTGSNTGPLGVPPGGPYFVNETTGTIQRQSNPVLALALVTAGWTGFPTQALAQKYAASSPTVPVRKAVSSVTGPLGDIPSYIGAAAKWIQTRENWIRILQVLGGLVLMAIGVEHLSQATQSAAHTVAKAAVIA